MQLVRQELVRFVVGGLHEVVVVYKAQYKFDDIVVDELEAEHVSTKSYKGSSVKFLVRQ